MRNVRVKLDWPKYSISSCSGNVSFPTGSDRGVSGVTGIIFGRGEAGLTVL
jgi:hypothetical protein